MSTIAAISTPLGAGGLGVIRVSGKDAITICDRVFKSQSGVKLCDKKGYTAVFGKVFDKVGDIDDAVALVFRAPLSYTGENVVELSLHGGVYILTRTLEAVINSGAVPAMAGEFTRRAFLNGKMSLTQAESVMDTIHAEGVASARAALETREGALFNKISEIKRDLVTCEGHICAFIDFPDEGVDEVEDDKLLSLLKNALERLTYLINSYSKGKILREGVKTAIVGKPNVGKSTLMNRLSGFEKSIVTDIAGTTRDVVEESVRLNNITLRLFDTAGIRETDDKVEKIGVELAYKNIDSADLILAVFDASVKLDENDKNLIEKIKGRTAIGVVNKTDSVCVCDTEYIKANLENLVFISAKEDKTLEGLEDAIEKAVGVNNFDSSNGVLSNLRQLNCACVAQSHLNDAVASLQNGFTLDAVGVCVESAIEALTELTGESASEAVIDEVFSKFCVGK